MKTIWWVYAEDEHAGEIEGMFTDEGECLGLWQVNDASWRNEYFSPFMKRLAINVKEASGKKEKELVKKLAKEAQDCWGLGPEEEEEEE